ncbi:MAG: hypothetical protein Q8L22_19210 [Reyranella sp.]|nr:hypothetical protein [Reyranella sp.]
MPNAAMQPTDIADTLDRFQWDALRALCAPSPDPSRLSGAAVEQLVKDDLLELHDDRPSLTAKGRRVVVCGSPTLWNS